jgi:hypothetical protein
MYITFIIKYEKNFNSPVAKFMCVIFTFKQGVKNQQYAKNYYVMITMLNAAFVRHNRSTYIAQPK